MMQMTTWRKITVNALVGLTLLLMLVTPNLSMATLVHPRGYSLGMESSMACSLIPDSKKSTSLLPMQQSMPNVIYLIGDGMGPEYLKIASLIEYGIENGTIMDLKFPYHSLYDTRNILNETTDSAAGGTALATGHLTINERISMDRQGKISFKTILEYLVDDYNYSAGLVTTDELYGATPATFAAHVTSRDKKSEIFNQLLTRGLDVLLGGGLHSPFVGGESRAKKIGNAQGFDVATNLTELEAIYPSARRLLGLFGGTRKYSLPFEIDRNVTSEPSLLDMTKAALDVLSRTGKPFFLMVEGARIDHAGHQSNLTRAVLETIMFEKVARLIFSFAKQNNNTIVIVGADHETGGLHLLDYTLDNTNLPRKGLTREDNNTIRLKRIQNLTISWSGSGGHTNTLVSFYGFGSASFGTLNVSRTPDIFWAVNVALGKFPVIMKHEFFVDKETSMLKSSLTVKDLDKSWNRVTIHVEYDNGSVFSQQFNFTPDAMVTEEVTLDPISVDLAANFTAWMSISDAALSVEITSLRFRYLASTETTFSLSTSSETSGAASSGAITPSFDWFTLVFIVMPFSVVLLRTKKRKEK